MVNAQPEIDPWCPGRERRSVKSTSTVELYYRKQRTPTALPSRTHDSRPRIFKRSSLHIKEPRCVRKLLPTTPQHLQPETRPPLRSSHHFRDTLSTGPPATCPQDSLQTRATRCWSQPTRRQCTPKNQEQNANMSVVCGSLLALTDHKRSCNTAQHTFENDRTVSRCQRCLRI